MIELHEVFATLNMWNPLKITLIKTSFRRFDTGLFITLLIRLLFPSIYTTIRVYILGTVKQNDAIDIIAQLQWVIIILEITEEGLLQPLYHCFGQSITNVVLQPKIRSGFFICLIFYVVFCGITGIFAPQLVDIMGVENKMDLRTIILYIRLELCGIFMKGLSKLFYIILVLKKKSLCLNIILLSQLLCSILMDIFFFS